MNEDTQVPCTNCINFDDNLKCLNTCDTIKEKCCNNCKCNGCSCEILDDKEEWKFKPNYIAMEEY